MKYNVEEKEFLYDTLNGISLEEEIKFKLHNVFVESILRSRSANYRTLAKFLVA
jgi:hypothetical protein